MIHPRAWLPTLLVLGLLSIAASAVGSDFSLLDAPSSKLERCIRRCEREHGASPSPVPTRSPSPVVTPACSGADRIEKLADGHWRKTIDMRVGEERTLCVDLPPKAFPFFTIYTVNKGNASCADLAMTAISPAGKWTVDAGGPAPVVRPNNEPGRWLVKLDLRWGSCTRFEFNIQH